MDSYYVLGLSPGASRDQIRERYKKLALKYHPDKNPNDNLAKDNFKRIVSAYRALTRPDQSQSQSRFHFPVIRFPEFRFPEIPDSKHNQQYVYRSKTSNVNGKVSSVTEAKSIINGKETRKKVYTKIDHGKGYKVIQSVDEHGNKHVKKIPIGSTLVKY